MWKQTTELSLICVCRDNTDHLLISFHPVCVRLCVQAKGFELSYLEKVVEVKDTVHRQSLLHHTCSQVVENYPESSDVYSEIPAITRSAKVQSY